MVKQVILEMVTYTWFFDNEDFNAFFVEYPHIPLPSLHACEFRKPKVIVLNLGVVVVLGWGGSFVIVCCLMLSALIRILDRNILCIFVADPGCLNKTESLYVMFSHLSP